MRQCPSSDLSAAALPHVITCASKSEVEGAGVSQLEPHQDSSKVHLKCGLAAHGPIEEHGAARGESVAPRAAGVGQRPGVPGVSVYAPVTAGKYRPATRHDTSVCFSLYFSFEVGIPICMVVQARAVVFEPFLCTVWDGVACYNMLSELHPRAAANLRKRL